MATETNIHRESRLAKLNALTEKGYNPYRIVSNRMLLPPICRKNTKICRPEKIPKTG